MELGFLIQMVITDMDLCLVIPWLIEMGPVLLRAIPITLASSAASNLTSLQASLTNEESGVWSDGGARIAYLTIL